MPAPVHLFNTHFYQTLHNSGIDMTLHCHALKGFTRVVDIFSKRWLYIPIWLRTHFSLVVIVNPGYIKTCFNNDGSPRPLTDIGADEKLPWYVGVFILCFFVSHI